jgi:uncharacterized protein
MNFVICLLDKPNSTDLRLSIRPAHKAYLSEISDRIAFAGPLMSDDASTMIGSLLVIDFASRSEAAEWLAQEPFTRAGLYASTSIWAFENLWPQNSGYPKKE